MVDPDALRTRIWGKEECRSRRTCDEALFSQTDAVQDEGGRNGESRNTAEANAVVDVSSRQQAKPKIAELMHIQSGRRFVTSDLAHEPSRHKLLSSPAFHCHGLYRI